MSEKQGTLKYNISINIILRVCALKYVCVGFVSISFISIEDSFFRHPNLQFD